MRLLNVHSFKFTEFRDDKRPNYVIASHRWVDGCEATFQDVRDGRNCDKAGYKKIEAFAGYVRRHVQPIEWLWIDTCCINKDSAAELSEAINLMFDWYRNAELCIAYLADVDAADNKRQFEKSEWFKRGWTLQELLAPRIVIFVTNSWQVIGNKAASTHGGIGTLRGPSLERDIAGITGIPEQALHTFQSSRGWSIEERLRWMEGRKTTREEDMSYALYGIFGVTPGANYGERHDGARQRLLAAINHHENIAAQQADRFREITNWLSPPDPWKNHESARLQHEPQTGTWLLDCDDYRNWKSGSFNRLWVYGKAGCGKTVLCSTVIGDMKIHCQNAVNAGYIVFYFSFSDTQKQRYENLLLSAVNQLGWREPGFSMLQQAYEKPGRSIPGREELEEILLSCIRSYDELFVVLDALDECPEENDGRLGLFTGLTRLMQKAPQLKILATSRELPEIRQSMATMGAVPLSIATHSVDTDIRRYVSMQLSRDHRLSRLNLTTKALIEETFSAKADGMFRWAYCQLQELKKLKSTRPSFVKEALYSLPSTLDETYERMLMAIERDLRPDALTLLRWLAYARSPPTLSELVDVTVIDLTAEGTVKTEDRPGLDDTLEILSGLVTIIGGERNEDEDEDVDDEDVDDEHVDDEDVDDEDASWDDSGSEGKNIGLARPCQQVVGDTRVRLAHFSVKEYLESERILESSAKDFHLKSTREHNVLSQSCLVYLMHYSNSDEKLSAEQDLETFPLLGYAAELWYYHSALQGDIPATRETGLLCNEIALRDWLLVHQPEQGSRAVQKIGSSLYYASLLGIEQVVSELLGKGADVNFQGGLYGYALQAASIRGHERVVQMLIDARADVNVRGGDRDNALLAALLEGHERVVQILLDAGADISAPGEVFGNVLQVALVRGNEKIVQMLIDAGADVHARGGIYGNALRVALEVGNERMVQMLIDAGADTNARGKDGSNALQVAVVRGNEKILQMLIDSRADVNAQGREGIDTLQAEKFRGDERLVQVLIGLWANVNAGKEISDSVLALHAALEAESKRGGIYDNALQAAPEAEHEKRGICGNALQAALQVGNERMVQMLIDAGADCDDAQGGGKYGDELQAASKGGLEEASRIRKRARQD